MTYIVVSSNEIVKAEMERPECQNSNNTFAVALWAKANEDFQRHCLSLPRIAIQGKHKWEVWQSVEEGKDFIWNYEMPSIKGGWFTVEKRIYDYAKDYKRRIVAVPTFFEHEDNSCLRSLNGGKMCKHLCEGCFERYKMENVEETNKIISNLLPTPIEQTKSEQGDKPNCSRHKKELFGQTDMKVVAEAIGDLHYEGLHDLFARLCEKFSEDAINDNNNGRYELGKTLNDASETCDELTVYLHKAWQISKPYMTNDNPQTK